MEKRNGKTKWKNKIEKQNGNFLYSLLFLVALGNAPLDGRVCLFDNVNGQLTERTLHNGINDGWQRAFQKGRKKYAIVVGHGDLLHKARNQIHDQVAFFDAMQGGQRLDQLHGQHHERDPVGGREGLVDNHALDFVIDLGKRFG